MKFVDVFFVEVSHENILGCGSYRALVPPVDTDLAGGRQERGAARAGTPRDGKSGGRPGQGHGCAVARGRRQLKTNRDTSTKKDNSK